MRRRSRWALKGLGCSAGVAVLVLLDLTMGGHADGYRTMRVRGRVVDARSGEPVGGAALLTLFRPEESDPAQVEWRWRVGRSHERAQAEDDDYRACSMITSARTGPNGTFETLVGLPTYWPRTAFTGIELGEVRGDPFKIVRALLVKADGYTRLVHPTADARWEEHDVEKPGSEIVGTFDVGTIRLEPR